MNPFSSNHVSCLVFDTEGGTVSLEYLFFIYQETLIIYIALFDFVYDVLRSKYFVILSWVVDFEDPRRDISTKKPSN